MKKKDWFIIITLIIFAMLTSSLVSVAATGNLFDSNEVVYDNASSGMNSSDVKNAIDELYAAANDYSDINTRLSKLESYTVGTITSRLNNDGIQLGYGNSNGFGWADWFYNGTNVGNIFTGNNAFNINTRNNASLNLSTGSGAVNINGYDIANVQTGNGTINTSTTKTNGTASSIKWHKIGKLVVITMNDICPSQTSNTDSSVLATGVPKPSVTFTTTITPYYSGKYNQYRVEVKNINGEGKLYWWYTDGGSNCEISSGQLVYFVD